MFVNLDVRELRSLGITDFDQIIPTFCGRLQLIEIRLCVWPVGSPPTPTPHPPLTYHCVVHSHLGSFQFRPSFHDVACFRGSRTDTL